MRLKILGCSGGIGPDLRTTSLLIDDDILIDCGSGVGDLTVAQQGNIQHIFLTHAHLDHIGFIPFLVDTAFEALIDNPITIHLLENTLDLLRNCIFNWGIWPDFAKLPDAANPVIKYNVITAGQEVTIGNRTIRAIPVTHTQPSLGYRVQSENGGAFAFSGDTKTTDQFWQVLNSYDALDVLIVECAYADHEAELSEVAAHYRPTSLANDLLKLEHQPDIFVAHAKPGQEDAIISQLNSMITDRELKILAREQVFDF
jgi:ribonuclease BN (tRNA processing enzyme)